MFQDKMNGIYMCNFNSSSVILSDANAARQFVLFTFLTIQNALGYFRDLLPFNFGTMSDHRLLKLGSILE